VIEITLSEIDMEYGRRLKTVGWDVGEMVVVHTLNDLVGEVTKKSLNGDGEYDYMVHYEGDGACEWCEYSDLREANDLDNWSLTSRGSMF
tara:strand:+ start:706 stop:975 length:270 start_codon:yes stop_codon:yes gene_type:complete